MTKWRTICSFTLLFLGFGSLFGLWSLAWRQPEISGVPGPIHQVLEGNGRLWHSLFDPRKQSHGRPPPSGKKPRVNGLIGLDAPIDLANWRLDFAGRKISMEEIRALPRSETNANFRCIEGWSEDMSYAGVKFSDFVAAYGVVPQAYVGLETPDGAYYVSVDTQSMMHDQTILAYEMNGMPLRPENGAPLRLVIPVKYGIKSLKRIGKVFFSERRPPDYWAEQGYDWFSGL